MFETFAVLSTLSCAAIFVLLWRLDRAGRREDAQRDADGPPPRD